MTRLLMLVALSIGILATQVEAKPPGDGDAAKAQRAGKGQKDGKARQGRAARGPQGGGQDSQQMVARMLQRFDQNGDQKLDSTELAALLTSLRERRGMGRGNEAGAGRPGPGAGQRRGGKQRGAGQRLNPGGQRPKRPNADNEA